MAGTAEGMPIAASATLTCTVVSVLPRFGQVTVTRASAPADCTVMTGLPVRTPPIRPAGPQP